MPESKNILFITHHNNDFDHFLPLMVKLKKEKMSVKVIAFYTKWDVLKNKLHKYICDDNQIYLDEMADICRLTNFNKTLLRVYRYILENYKLEKIKKNKQGARKLFQSPNNILLKYLNILFIKYFVLCSIFLVSNKKIYNYLKINDIDLAIIDQRVIDKSSINNGCIATLLNVLKSKISHMDYILFRYCSIVRKEKIPIFMMPHGPQPIVKKTHHEVYKNLNNPFHPDFLVLCSNDEFSFNEAFHKHVKAIKKTFILGDPRFDINWINYLQSCALKVYGDSLEKTKNRKVMLYLVDNFPYFKNGIQEYKFNMHKDILSLVNHFPDLVIWVKHHPRNVFEIPIELYVNKNRMENVRQFGNDIDTNVLLAKADIFVSAASTVFISPIIQRKPVIFYNKWKKSLRDIPSIFDDLPLRASDEKELVTQYKRIVNGRYEISESYLESFYKKIFSTESVNQVMVEKYIEKIDEILQSQ